MLENEQRAHQGDDHADRRQNREKIGRSTDIGKVEARSARIQENEEAVAENEDEGKTKRHHRGSQDQSESCNAKGSKSEAR